MDEEYTIGSIRHTCVGTGPEHVDYRDDEIAKLKFKIEALERAAMNDTATKIAQAEEIARLNFEVLDAGRCNRVAILYKSNDSDNINHPAHYCQGIECADYVESHDMNFFQGNAVKYLTRFKHKGTALEDLKKARWYLDRLIEKENLKKGTI